MLIQLMPKIRKFIHFTFLFHRERRLILGIQERVSENAQRMIQLTIVAKTLPMRDALVHHVFLVLGRLLTFK